MLLIRPKQAGFRLHHSTTTQLVNIVDEILNSLNGRHNKAAAFLDVEKSFDKIWHDGLIFKIFILGVPN